MNQGHGMDLTQWIAVLGMVTGILALALNAWQYVRSGPRLKVSAKSGYRSTEGDSSFVLVQVNNVGTRGTTITAVGIQKCSRWIQGAIAPHPTLHPLGKWWPLPDESFIVHPGTFKDWDVHGYFLEPGKSWHGAIEQTTELEETLKARLCFFEVDCVDRIYYARLRRTSAS
jgi:hypothetical protein